MPPKHRSCKRLRPIACARPASPRADDPDRTGGLFFSHPVNRTSANGVTGEPSRASAEHGRRLFGMMVEDLAFQVRGALRETPPLAHSYFATV